MPLVSFRGVFSCAHAPSSSDGDNASGNDICTECGVEVEFDTDGTRDSFPFYCGCGQGVYPLSPCLSFYFLRSLSDSIALCLPSTTSWSLLQRKCLIALMSTACSQSPSRTPHRCVSFPLSPVPHSSTDSHLINVNNMLPISSTQVILISSTSCFPSPFLN
jgi:hypothetical protein